MLANLATPPTPAVESGRREESHAHNLLHPCCPSGGCILDTNHIAPPVIPGAHQRSRSADPSIAPLLVNTASAARWRRREGNEGNSIRPRPTPTQTKLAKSDLVLSVSAMEEVHGVDVSWLHKPNKDAKHHRATHSSPDVTKDLKAPPQPQHVPPRKPSPQPVRDPSQLPSPPIISPPTPVQPSRDTTNALPSTPTPSSIPKQPSTPPPPPPTPQQQQQAQQPKRPSLLNRASADRLSSDGKSGSKRSSWMNSLSSKFSSQGTPERPGPIPTQPQKQPSTPPATNGTPNGLETTMEEAEPYTPAKPKESSSSFFSSITRRLSAASQSTGIPKVQGSGGVCPRVVLNVDPNRERCVVPEMDASKLRRVSFCVDVEIAGGPRYVDDDEDEEQKKRKKKEFKMKEKAEGAALKNPEALIEEKDTQGEPELESKSKTVARTSSKESSNNGQEENTDPATPATPEERDAAQRKKEKKQKSEAERKERKEKRRRRAEESGSIPVELALDGQDADAIAGSSPSGTPRSEQNGKSAAPSTPVQPQPNAHAKQDRPTTDPARIYRRCCQLRESPILKRITEQLSNPKCILPHEPGVVNCLDLTGSRLQLADVVTLGDWLAVVPVKHLKLENADLNDEGIRCIFAGLLAAKKPEPTKRRSVTPKHRDGLPFQSHQERAGVVEKITLKNNPRITRVGWKHISLFIYMCRSLKAIDLSMNQFPESLPPSAHSTPIKSPQNAPPGPGQDIDAAEALFQCLSQRIGGKKLEELLMSECGLTDPQVRKIVDGTIMCGVSRLGLAGNYIDDEGLEYVLHYLRSGTCQALDLGGIDLRGKLDLIANALNVNADLPCWGLSLADCNLDSASLKPLFAQLVKLPNFRFIDLSHNRDLCSADNGLISLLRRYMGQLKELKRIHLADVNMSPKQAIALADVLPEGPRLAHLNMLENPQLKALANATTEADQEEACALYASLMAAVRVSNTLICIDIDVPSADNSEVVKALAKQVVAYSLRNMEQFAIAEATGNAPSIVNATAELTGPHGGAASMKEFTVPDVLMHLVGHSQGVSEGHDADAPAPDEDYIVGGTGVVKALQYVLGEKANDIKRTSLPPTPTGNTPTGALTPRDRPGSSAGLVEGGPVQAKKMSKNLLGSARKIRDRLQPALIKEAHSGNDLAYRRLLFLDQTLQSMIQRFEEEYPETRIGPASPKEVPSEASSLTDQSNLLASSVTSNQLTEMTTNVSDEEDVDGEDDPSIRPTASRHNSDVNLASRTLGLEEGRLHRLGQRMRREVLDSPGTMQFKDVPWQKQQQEERLKELGEKIENISGVDLKALVDEHGWEDTLKKIGANYDDLRQLQEQDPEAWESFRVAQEKAKLNM